MNSDNVSPGSPTCAVIKQTADYVFTHPLPGPITQTEEQKNS